uniref:TLE family member 5 isoform X1 n=1 Tax=Doryrhamphus excisus TaxID=161450 RepID=UPI0025AE4B8F|nr:TLE family member 5 isoform X1 [Doryrhamphus excisus]
MMFPQSRHSASSQQLKFTTSDSCDRIKDEFQFLQAQYHSLKLECDKLASEKSEMQRHYIMYYEMSYGLNIEMHKQAEIVKRLNGICAQVLPYLSQEHQQQVLAAIERAKQVTPPEMNSIIRLIAGDLSHARQKQPISRAQHRTHEGRMMVSAGNMRSLEPWRGWMKCFTVKVWCHIHGIKHCPVQMWRCKMDLGMLTVHKFTSRPGPVLPCPSRRPPASLSVPRRPAGPWNRFHHDPHH